MCTMDTCQIFICFSLLSKVSKPFSSWNWAAKHPCHFISHLTRSIVHRLSYFGDGIWSYLSGLAHPKVHKLLVQTNRLLLSCLYLHLGRLIICDDVEVIMTTTYR